MAASYQTSSPQADGARAATVLIVEDEPAIAEVVRDVLEDAAISAEACPLGWQAHLCIRRQQPKVIILDVQMPNVDGITLFYSIRNDPKTQDIPVIFLTANPQKVQQELPNYEAMGATLIPKPFDLDTLLEQVKQALAQDAG